MKDDFKVVIAPDFGPFEFKQEEKWYSNKDLRLASVLSEIDSPDISKAVAAAPTVFKEADMKSLEPDTRFALGQALALEGHTKEACLLLSEVASEMTKNDADYAEWILWHAGWAAWLARDEQKATDIFNSILVDSAGKATERIDWDNCDWICAWFLGKASEKDFIEFYNDGWSDFPFFFIGEKLLKEGKKELAKNAYKQCIDASEKMGDDWLAHDWPENWARWRMKQMEEQK